METRNATNHDKDLETKFFSDLRIKKKLITTLWMTIHHLPIEYQVPKLMIQIGNSIRTTVALDGRNIFQAARSRIYVEIDLITMPLAMVEVNQRQHKVTGSCYYDFRITQNWIRDNLQYSNLPKSLSLMEPCF